MITPEQAEELRTKSEGRTGKSTRVKKTPAKGTRPVHYDPGIYRDRDLPFTATKVKIFKALKQLRATSPMNAVSSKAVQSITGLRLWSVRHYSYHAQASGHIGVVESEEYKGYGYYLTLKGQKVNLEKEHQKYLDSKKSKKSEDSEDSED